MKKYKKWIIAGSLAVLAAALCAGLYVRKVQRENKSYSLIYIPKVVDGTNDFWTSLILGTEMAAKEYRADIAVPDGIQALYFVYKGTGAANLASFTLE